MIRAEFIQKENQLIGFTVKGHAGAGAYGNDIVCAGVSSGIMLTINTITDYFHGDADINISEDTTVISLLLNFPYDKISIKMIESFYNHLSSIKEEYGHIDLKIAKK